METKEISIIDNKFYAEISELLQRARNTAYQAVNAEREYYIKETDEQNRTSQLFY